MKGILVTDAVLCSLVITDSGQAMAESSSQARSDAERALERVKQSSQHLSRDIEVGRECGLITNDDARLALSYLLASLDEMGRMAAIMAVGLVDARSVIVGGVDTGHDDVATGECDRLTPIFRSGLQQAVGELVGRVGR